MRGLPLFLVLLAGCEQAMREPMPARPASRSMPSEAALSEAGAPPAGAGKSLPAQADLARKIIYTANVSLVVEDFTPIPAQVEALAKRLGGYVSHSKITGSPGTARTGLWTLRVPVDRYADCLAGARALGEVRSVESDSRDATEEFYDLEARLRNKKQEEDRLLKLLATAAGKLEEVLAVERELSRVRGEIEQMEGRKRLLTDQIDLSTVNLSVEEIKNYVPEEAPTYTTRARRALRSSVVALVSTATEFSIILVALAPWLAVLLPLGLVVGLWRRRRRRARSPERNA